MNHDHRRSRFGVNPNHPGMEGKEGQFDAEGDDDSAKIIHWIRPTAPSCTGSIADSSCILENSGSETGSAGR